MTILERNANAAPFRLISVAATGSLTLDGLTLRGGRFDLSSIFFCGSGLHTAGGRVTISKSAIVNNRNDSGAGNGGGLCIEGGATITITASPITGNDSAGSFSNGGGLYINSSATVSITASTISENAAYASGGGLYIASGATVTITDTAIVGNSALFIGGLYNAGTLTIINSTVAQNMAGQGQYSALSSPGSARILNSTFVENNANGITRGFVIAGNITLQNTILAHNTSIGEPSDCSSGISLGNNLFDDIAECQGHGPFTVLLPSDLTGNPGLGPYTDDDTPGTAHYPLLQGSRAINAGNPAACPKTDQLGEKRVGTCDIGAIEFQGTAVSSR